MDSANREKPRFPAAQDEVARNAIREAVGANGGDILFLEVCEELGVPTEMMLALPEGPFVEASVAADDPKWEKRFYAQLEK